MPLSILAIILLVCDDFAIAHDKNCPNILIIGSLLCVNNNLLSTCGIKASLFEALNPALFNNFLTVSFLIVSLNLFFCPINKACLFLML